MGEQHASNAEMPVKDLQVTSASLKQYVAQAKRVVTATPRSHGFRALGERGVSVSGRRVV